MRRVSLAAVAVVSAALISGCGPEGGLPPEAGLPSSEVTPTAPVPENEVQEAAKSLWPLTAQSRWTYRITDPVRGSFDKTVEVQGEQELPDMPGTMAVAVRSSQPHLEELSFQVVNGGIVFRVREQDMKAGQVVRAMTWDPAVMKALSDAQPVGWTQTATVVEVERDAAGSVVKEKEKVFGWTVEAVDQEVTVPAGTFTNAIKLRRERADKDDWERFYWLVPGVGKVLEEGERREELVEYDVKS